jgi:MarR-like DNA-binding transcriptional regulator SgrR of sgrS sRNA
LWLCGPDHQEHQQIVQTIAHTLNDHANKVRQDLIELSVENIREKCKRKADEWRDQMYAEIDAKYNKGQMLKDKSMIILIMMMKEKRFLIGI